MENSAWGISGIGKTDAQQAIRAFSHDMRAPLENMIALVTLSLDRLGDGDAAGETVSANLQKVLVAARDMERMADDLLLGEEGPVRQERFCAQDIARSVAAAVGESAAQRRQLMHIDVSGLGRWMLRGDYAALTRILINLMSNAVKYTQEGGKIILTAQGAINGQGAMDAEFAVEDDGMGMDAAFAAKMFDPYARAEQAVQAAIPGNGLGLAIVRRLADRLGGTICVQSAPGRGTRIALRVTLDAAREAAYSLAGRRFLLAEDNDLSAEIIQEVLRQQGAGVNRVADGVEAVRGFEAMPAGAFDAILLDMHMPVMDGCTAASRIRALAREDARCIPILALTAGGGRQDEAEAKCAGMNGCLRKPLDTQALCAALGARAC